ncbi:MAG: hypothetical protein M3M86_01345 [Thermoproteota archaeon]|nr:hypothetical protein [Thermoproteota archaeon]
MARHKKDLAMKQSSLNIEHVLKEQEAEQEAVENLKTYKGFCVRRDNSRHIHNTTMEEDQTASRKPMVLEFISIICEHIALSIEAAGGRYDFSSSSNGVSGVEIPRIIELPKSMTIQRVRIPHGRSQEDIDTVGRRIQIAVADLDVHEIQAGKDVLSQLLPVGGWHYVKSRLKLINFEKNCIYEEYSPQPCCMPSCPICMAVVVAKKGKEKRLEPEIQKHVRKRESLQVRTS